MNHYEETISKFLDAMNVDLRRDVRFQRRCYGSYYCVCGQKIKKGYMFKNIKNGKGCVVGKNCLKYVADHLNWKKQY